eukprot:6459077-Amphidinium_carterae.1
MEGRLAVTHLDAPRADWCMCAKVNAYGHHLRVCGVDSPTALTLSAEQSQHAVHAVVTMQ